MTPNELYAAKSHSEEDWRETDAETIQMVFGIAGFGYRFFQGAHPLDESRIVFSRKADYTSDGERSSSLRTVSFDGRPFAFLSVENSGSSEDIDTTVTDEAVFRLAREHIVSFLVEADHDHTVTSPEADVVKGTQTGVLVKVDDALRLANPFHCRWSDGVLVFDTDALDDAYRQLFAGDGERLRSDGLLDRDLRAKALRVFAAAVVPRFAVLSVDRFTPEGHWVPIAFADGVHTHMVTVTKRDFTRGSGWRAQGTTRIGPPCMLSVMECVTENREVTSDNVAVGDLVERFGISSDLAVETLNRWASDCGQDLLDMVLEAMDTEVPVDPENGQLTGYRVAAYVADHPEAVVYCVDGYPSRKQAVELMENVARIIERNARATASPLPR